MKTSTILTTTSLAVLLSSFGLVACGGSEVEPADQTQGAALSQEQSQKTPANEAMRPEARDARGPRGGHRFGPPSPDKMIERFDANKNGQLEAAELPERMQENIGDIDKSGDGIVTKDELTAHFEARRAEHQAKFEQHAKERFEKKDANHDGALDQNELGDRWSKLSAADANGDQKLTQDELKAAFQSGKIKPEMVRGEHGRRFERGAPPSEAPARPAAATPQL